MLDDDELFEDIVDEDDDDILMDDSDLAEDNMLIDMELFDDDQDDLE